MLLRQHDCIHVAAIIAFPTVNRTPITEKRIGLGVGAARDAEVPADPFDDLRHHRLGVLQMARRIVDQQVPPERVVR